MCTRPGFGLLIAYFNIVIFSVGVITSIALLCSKTYIDKLVAEEVIDDPTTNVKQFKTALRATIAFFLVVCLFIVAVSGVLARGIHKRRHRYMVPWLVLYALSIICILAGDFFILFKFKKSLGKFACGMCITIVQCLIFYPIYSFYRDVRMEN